MDSNEVIATFRRALCNLYGYDENLKFVGAHRPLPLATDGKALLEPRDFLNFAVEDSAALEQERNRINCLSNCKRAIDAQVDRLIRSLGFFPITRRERWNIPKKLKFISQSGVLTPRILGNVNRLRNQLEHEFISPSKREVEDALDVATLFVSYAELVHIPAMNWTFSGKLSVRYDYDEMVFRFYEKEPPDSPGDDVLPLLSLVHGDAEFQGFYDFLMKTVPSMKRKGRLGEDV